MRGTDSTATPAELYCVFSKHRVIGPFSTWKDAERYRDASDLNNSRVPWEVRRLHKPWPWEHIENPKGMLGQPLKRKNEEGVFACRNTDIEEGP